MFVIGTAGHIDHGKSTLIQALTGIDPDRLREEKARGMTIDLGFAWMTLPSGLEVGIVDVPGHQRFIRNMLAGVGSIDLTLLVVAANEGWMPQSQEHLEILDLLGVRRGIVVLTKRDLVDQEWLELVQEEVREHLAGTALAGAPFVPVSSTTGEGLEELKAAIDRELGRTPPPADAGRPRLWIDRVFSIRGAGTVVTGTLTGGSLTVDQEVEILPNRRRARIRTLQTHKRQLQRAEPGSRAAVNLVGVETEELARGSALVAPGQWELSRWVNVELRVLPGLDHPLRDGERLKVYLGSAELEGRLRLLAPVEQPVPQEEAPGGPGGLGGVASPGARVLAQIQLGELVGTQLGDRFVVRDPARQETTGGGRVLDPLAARVHPQTLSLALSSALEARQNLLFAGEKRRKLNLQALRLRARADLKPEDLVALLLQERNYLDLRELPRFVPFSGPLLEGALAAVRERAEAVVLPSHLIHPANWKCLAGRIRQELAAYHQRYPLQPGMPRETLRTALALQPRLFEEAIGRLVEEGAVAAGEATLRLPSHRVELTEEQKQEAERLMALVEQNPGAPPSLDELTGPLGFSPELVAALVDQGRLVKVTRGLAFSARALEAIRRRLREHIETHGSVDVATARDLLQTTRKYAVPLMEYLDHTGFTRRVGDRRVLGPRAETEE